MCLLILFSIDITGITKKSFSQFRNQPFLAGSSGQKENVLVRSITCVQIKMDLDLHYMSKQQSKSAKIKLLKRKKKHTSSCSMNQHFLLFKSKDCFL